MNPDNNFGNQGIDNSLGSANLGAMPAPDATPVQPVSSVNPTSNLSSIGIENLSNNIANNQASDVTLSGAINDFAQPAQPEVASQQPVVDAAPVNEFVTEPASNTNLYQEPQMQVPNYQADVTMSSTSAPEQMVSEPAPMPQGLNDLASGNALNQNPQGLGDALNNQPAPGLNQSVQEPLINNDINQAAPQVDAPTGPTMPIPDSMPEMGYQAGVSTPVDYATPMSNFDEIGTTPELDPKAKSGNKKGGKTALFALIILAIGALGAGSYYLINVKHIFDKSSVKLKDVVVEQGGVLSENINDYATFTNTSSANCVQDLTNVDVNVAGTYTYTIKCGTDEYTGKITVQDTTAPSVVLKPNVVQLENIANVTADSFVESCDEEPCAYRLVEGQDLATITTEPGVVPVKISVSDQNDNTANVIAPLYVVSNNVHIGLAATKEAVTTDEYIMVEKDIILYSDNNTYLAYTMYQFSFMSEAAYNSVGSLDGDTISISDYSGYPVYNKNNLKITLVSKEANNLIQGSYAQDREALASVGYTVEAFASDHLSILNY